MAAYVELHCHSYFSLLDGASSPEDLLTRAVELEMPALALTDHDAVYGAVRFVQAAGQMGIHPLLGAELTLQSGDSGKRRHHLTLLAENDEGWQHLCQLITLARDHAPKGEAWLPLEMLPDYTEGLIALSGCQKGEISDALLGGDLSTAQAMAHRYRDWFGQDHFFIELHNHLLPQDDSRNARLVALAQQTGIGYVATNNVHYATQDRHRLQDVLVCIRHNLTLDEASQLLRPNSEYYLKSADEMKKLFYDFPDALSNTLHIADRCRFEPHFGLQALPTFPTPDRTDAHLYLESLCRTGLYAKRIEPSERLLRQMDYELSVIERSGLSNYFLIVWDIVHFARSSSILCQGRGSAANSLVAYLLGISPVNPLDHNLVFERFLSDERQVVPDIDIDFDAARREEVIQYVYQKYGIEHAAMACTFITFRARSALRDVGKVLGLPPELLERTSTSLDTYQPGSIAHAPGFREVIGERSAAQIWGQLTELCTQIDGFPRHLGIHNGGMIIMSAPLSERLPTEPATMVDRYVVQWDKDSLEAAGLVKIDILGLRMLSAIAESLEMVNTAGGQAIDLDHLPFNDPAVYEMVSRADTIGVFQVESRAQAQVLPRLQPRTFNDLIVSISLIRPGPVQGDMVHPYLRRRLGVEAVRYPHPLLEPALEETLGVVLFQEQVLKVARDLAGFTAGQGEQLRRALGAKRAADEIERFHTAFLEGAQSKGVEQAIAGAVFDTLRAFGGYSFPKSHAAAFAVLVYQSAWLKRYHPQAFYAALLNNQPMGFWSLAVIVNDAKRRGIDVLPVDINLSRDRCQIEGQNLRLGYNYVKGLGDRATGKMMEAKVDGGSFQNLLDFCKRTQLPRRLIEHLILAGAMDGWGKTRRKLIWELGKLSYRENELDLIFPEDELQFPAVSPLEVMGIEYDMLGLSLRNHLMSMYRNHLTKQGIMDSAKLERSSVGSEVQAAGLIVVHQAPPTAKGHHFITLEDEFGFINVVVHPDIYARYRKIWREHPLLIVDGNVQKQGQVTNLVAVRATALA
ncbi:MAG TPA: error-prone DNA polymerase [Phototrophicaceae bacterium]|nr:error-prone DNA polymerase [Phototrophicaceae bacterium]